MDECKSASHEELHLLEEEEEEEEGFVQNRIFLCEIIGATNLAAALRESGDRDDASTATNCALLSTYCKVKWGGRLLHQTKAIRNNNNPIWACDTGSLFLLEPDESRCGSSFLRIEVHGTVRGSRGMSTMIGALDIPTDNILNGNWCDEERKQFKLNEDLLNINQSDSDESDASILATINSALNKKVSYKRILGELEQRLLDISMDIHEEKSGDEDSVASDEVPSDVPAGVNRFSEEVGDDYIYGSDATLSLRFRVASEDDISFLQAIDLDARHYKLSHEKMKLLGVLSYSKGKDLATLITEGSTSYRKNLNTKFVKDLANYRLRGTRTDDEGVTRIRIKPNADPLDPNNTKFMSEAELEATCQLPSRTWVEAGSGSRGLVMLEILSCEDLPNMDFGRALGNKTDPFICIVYEDCLVETDVISDCLNPMWMPWTQRAFVFKRMNALSSIYLGVFDHEFGPFKHAACGRVTIDIGELEPHTVYNLEYDLFKSPLMSNRKKKGKIRVRLQLVNYDEHQPTLSIKPDPIYVNVQRSKTLSVARYTVYGKRREEVYNMKILRSYIDEIMEYMELSSFEVTNALDSLVFWRGQVAVGDSKLPLHSALFFYCSIYVVERLYLLPTFIFFTIAYCMLIMMNERRNHPLPWYRCKSFGHYVEKYLPWFEPKEASINISAGEGFKEANAQREARQKRMEEDRLLQSKIAQIRRDLQEILMVISDVSIQTSEGVEGLNPLRRLLPIQLLLKDVLYYVRIVKTIVCCHYSHLSAFFIASNVAIGLAFLILPWQFMLHWLCRILVWTFLGPWMKVADMLYERRDDVGMEKVMEEIREREQKMWLSARERKEEAIKLKATRMTRFGRFSLKVPCQNITRHFDYPLPQSTARPAPDKKMSLSKLNIKKFIPGQKHVGLMIPSLYEYATPEMDEEEIKEEEVEKILPKSSEDKSRSFELTPLLTIEEDDNEQSSGSHNASSTFGETREEHTPIFREENGGAPDKEDDQSSHGFELSVEDITHGRGMKICISDITDTSASLVPNTDYSGALVTVDSRDDDVHGSDQVWD